MAKYSIIKAEYNNETGVSNITNISSSSPVSILIYTKNSLS